MPVMNGFDATKEILEIYSQLKDNPQYKHIERPNIYAMTSFGDTDELRRWTVSKCTKAGMRGIMYKPLNLKGLSI